MRSSLPPLDMERRPEALRLLARATLSPARYAHVVRVTDELLSLAVRHGLEASSARVCGLGHDLCRELPDPEVVALAERDGIPLADWERAEPMLLHGRAAAQFLRERFGLQDEAVLDAVRWHTTGRAGMGNLAKALFIADYIEPGRTHVDEPFRERIRAASLSEGALLIVTHTIQYLQSIGRPVAPPALELYAALSENGGAA